MEPAKVDDRPYCVNCGYPLMGLTESSKCPECGRPLVEVLVRNSFPGAKPGKRYRSERTLFGLPLVSIATGPYGDEKVGRPVGIVAIGDHPRGVIAIGGAPVGFIAIGGIARGVIAVGGTSIGVVAIGGAAVGGLALGGFGLGLFTICGFGIAVLGGVGGQIIRLF